MTGPPWVVRRGVAVPAVVVLAALSVPAFAVAAGAGLLTAPLLKPRRWRAVRMSALAGTYFWLESAALLACLGLWLARVPLGRRRYQAAHVAVLGWALRLLRATSGRLVGFATELEEPPFPPDPAGSAEVAGAGPPVLVASRHAGVGDSFLLVHLLLDRYRRLPRVVLKSAMRWDPALDVLLSRLGGCFLPPGQEVGGAASDRVRALAAGLTGPDALLIFPEGANYTPHRRIRAIEHLRRRGHHPQARIAETMPHVLPPRPDGLLAAMAAAPAAPVVIVAHTGLDDLLDVRTVWNALPLTRPLRLRWWLVAAADIPADPDERLRWLLIQWALVDEWIDARKAAGT